MNIIKEKAVNKKEGKKKNKNTTPIKNKSISQFILDEISIRFLVEVDSQDMENIERFFFILEESHWFYLDNYNEAPVSFIDFCIQILNHNNIIIDLYDGLQKFKQYKQSIKVFGGIIFDRSLESVLIVRENAKTGSFGFPKGKKSKDEGGIDCAIREVREEIGYDISRKILKGVRINLFEKMYFYFVFNVNKKTKFQSSLQNEITDISWLSIKKLEEGHLGKKFSIITKSYLIWRELYLCIYANRFQFNRQKFINIIDQHIKKV